MISIDILLGIHFTIPSHPNLQTATLAADTRVQNIAQGIAHQVPGQHEQHDGHARKDHDVPVRGQRRDPVAGKADHLAPVGVAPLGAQAQEAQAPQRSARRSRYSSRR